MTYGIGTYGTVPYTAGGGAFVPTPTPSPGQLPYPCPCGALWRVEACDLATGRVRAVLRPIAVDVQTLFSKIGEGGGTLTFPIKGVRLRDVWPYLTSVYLTYDGTPVGGFIVEKVTGSGGTAQVGLKDITSYLNRRMIRTDTLYTAQQQTQIATSLVAAAIPDGIPLTGQAATSAYVRDREYLAVERPFIGPMLTDLMGSENGPEFTPIHTRTNGYWSTSLLWEDTGGNITDYILRGDVHGTDYGVDIDALDLTNLADGFGSGTPPLQATSDATASSPYPRFDANPRWDTVSEQATLQEQTDGYVAVRSEPYAIPSFTITGDNPSPADLRDGDTATFQFSRGVSTYHGPARILGTSWRASEGEPLIRALTLQPLGSATQVVLNQIPADPCRDC